ncbi:MAG: hypothetical protein NVSMB5_11480 [Candidatus Velthaea sp.]
MNVRKIALLAAGVMALAFGAVLFFFVQSFQHANSPESVRIRVLVSNRNIDKGVTVTPAMFTPAQRDRTTVDPDSVGDPLTLRGQFALIAIPAGAVLTQSRIGSPRDLGLSMRLKPGERAVSISVDRVKDVSGLILPGDRVDVLAAGPHVDNRIQPTVTLLRGVLILAIGQGLETTSASPTPEQANASTVTLALNPQQATKLVTADQNATLRLALRSPKERLSSEGVGEVIYNGRNTPVSPSEPASAPVVSNALSAPPSVAMTPPPAVRTAEPKSANISGRINGVEVIEGAALAASR